MPHPSYQYIWLGNIQLLLSTHLPTQKSSNTDGMINSIFNRALTLTLNLGLKLSKTANTQRTYSQPGEQGREKVRVSKRWWIRPRETRVSDSFLSERTVQVWRWGQNKTKDGYSRQIASNSLLCLVLIGTQQNNTSLIFFNTFQGEPLYNFSSPEFNPLQVPILNEIITIQQTM